jgi:thioredoxin reductase (NADPH)
MEIYDVVIVGAGPAGITAGIYAKRARLSTMVIEKLGVGGQIVLSDSVENYPGFPEISGYELMRKFEEQARSFDLEVEDGEVIAIRDEGEYKSIKTDDHEYKTRSVIIASGAKPSRLGVKGEEEFIGRGVSFCATCDGFFLRRNSSEGVYLSVLPATGSFSGVKTSLWLVAGILR